MEWSGKSEVNPPPVAICGRVKKSGEGCLKSDGSVKSDTSEIVQQLTINLIYIQNFEIFKKNGSPFSR